MRFGHQQSPENAVCSLLLLHSNKHCSCTMFIFGVSRVLCQPAEVPMGV